MRFRVRTTPASWEGTKYFDIWQHAYSYTLKEFVSAITKYGSYGLPLSAVPWLGTQEKEGCWDELHSGPPFIESGEFVKKYYLRCNPELQGPQRIEVKSYVSKIWRWSDIEFACGRTPDSTTNWQSTFVDNSTVSPDLVSTYGPAIYQALRPVKPGASLAQFLAEIKDVPRMLRQSALYFYEVARSQRSLAGLRYLTKRNAKEWLNLQFGWLPFVSDLRQFYTVYKNLDTLLSQLRTNSGKWLKRKRAVVDEEQVTRTEDYTTATSTNRLIKPILTSNWYANYYNSSIPIQHVMVDKIDHTLVWGTGRFRYYIPNVETPLWKAKAIAYMFGGIPSPLLIWELTPFSWLVDWFADLSQIYSKLDYELVDLCSQSLCAMRTVESEYHIHGTTYFADPTGALNSQFVFRTESKERRIGSLFGFGLSSEDFTPRQWSILGALGLTRLI